MARQLRRGPLSGSRPTAPRSEWTAVNDVLQQAPSHRPTLSGRRRSPRCGALTGGHRRMWGRAVGCENICGMQKWCEGDPVLRLIDAALRDMALRSALYVARRREDGDAKTFVIQTGEEGRFRLRLPDPRSDASLQALVAEAQDHLAQVLGAPVPLCPRHPHALLGIASRGQLKWVCPAGEWECALGDYAERTWPQVDLGGRLAPTLPARLQRRAGALSESRSLSGDPWLSSAFGR